MGGECDRKGSEERGSESADRVGRRAAKRVCSPCEKRKVYNIKLRKTGGCRVASER